MSPRARRRLSRRGPRAVLDLAPPEGALGLGLGDGWCIGHHSIVGRGLYRGCYRALGVGHDPGFSPGPGHGTGLWRGQGPT